MYEQAAPFLPDRAQVEAAEKAIRQVEAEQRRLADRRTTGHLGQAVAALSTLSRHETSSFAELMRPKPDPAGAPVQPKVVVSDIGELANRLESVERRLTVLEQKGSDHADPH